MWITGKPKHCSRLCLGRCQPSLLSTNTIKQVIKVYYTLNIDIIYFVGVGQSALWITINLWRPLLWRLEPVASKPSIHVECGLISWIVLVQLFLCACPEILYNGATMFLQLYPHQKKKKKRVLALKFDDFESYPMKISWFCFCGDSLVMVFLLEEKRKWACTSSFPTKQKQIKRCTKI